MNVKRFSGRSSRDALNLVRQAFGDDAVVLSTRPCADGVEVLAMAAASVPPAERAAPREVLGDRADRSLVAEGVAAGRARGPACGRGAAAAGRPRRRAAAHGRADQRRAP